MTDPKKLIAMARTMSDRETRHGYSVGDYWNLAEDMAYAFEAALARLEKAEAVCEAAMRYHGKWDTEDMLMAGDLFNGALQAWRTAKEAKP